MEHNHRDGRAAAGDGDGDDRRGELWEDQSLPVGRSVADDLDHLRVHSVHEGRLCTRFSLVGLIVST